MAQFRIAILFLAFGSLFLTLLGRVAYVQFVQGDLYTQRAQARKLRVDFIPARRGRILDRKGKVLAQDQGVFHLALTPMEVSPLICLSVHLRSKKYAVHRKILHELAQSSLEEDKVYRLGKVAFRRASRLLKITKNEPDRLPTLDFDMEEDGVVLSVKREFFLREPEIFTQLADLTKVSRHKLRTDWSKIITDITQIENDYERLVEWKSEQKLVSDLTSNLVRRIEVSHLPGVYITTSARRLYPHRESTWHLLGFLGRINRREFLALKKKDRILNYLRYKIKTLQGVEKKLETGYFLDESLGKRGLEKEYEHRLKGSKGAKIVERDYRNRTLKIVEEIKPKGGEDLRLTIDLKLQKTLITGFDEAEEKIQAGIFQSKTGHACGAGVAYDPATGEILALVSYPTITTKHRRLSPFINRAISGRYPPGSIFKPLTSLAFLEGKRHTTRRGEVEPWEVTPGSTVFCRGRFNGSRYFKCLGHHGRVGVTRSLKKSCNIYYYHFGEKFGGKSLARWGKYYGLDDVTGIDLAGEKRGNLPSPDWKRKRFKKKVHQTWHRGDSRNFSIGQGFLTVTPLAIATSLAAIFNRGRIMTPFLVMGTPPKVRRKFPVSDENLRAIYRGMRQVVHPGGTAQRTGLDQFLVAAKTGSAQDGHGFNYAWIAGVSWGMAKSRRLSTQERNHPGLWKKTPEIAFVIVVERTSGHGGDMAGPIANKLLEAYYGLDKVEKKSPSPSEIDSDF